MPNNTGPAWKNETDRKILAEVYKSFATQFDGQGNPTSYQEWFRGAGIVEQHPAKMARTLHINCNYRPLLMMKEVLALAERFGLEVYLQEVDANGNPRD
jgi:antibiotic biosynthesis monooxygenase (ABM) superfamily enzyme